MIDFRFAIENKEEVQQVIEQRRSPGNIELVVELYTKKNKLQQSLEQKQQERNKNAQKLKQATQEEDRSTIIERGKVLKEEITAIDAEYRTISEQLDKESLKLPNLIHEATPIAADDAGNIERSKWGTVPDPDFPLLDHLQLASTHDLVDFETATRVSGNKFYYLKNEAVLLELALIRYALDILKKHGFMLISTPDMVKEEISLATGYNPRSQDRDIYQIEADNLCLIGTSEIPLAAYHAGKILNAEELPIRLAGISHCYRREAGAAGKVSKGLYRVHQFSKVEMFIFSTPEQSQNEHDHLLTIEEEIMQGLELPYRVMEVCSGELGSAAYRKYDIEAWMPGRTEGGSWGEVTSASNCTDFQSRRLNIRYRTEQGEKQKKYVHTLNGTALAVSRILLALLENGQQKDGSIVIPDILHPLCGFQSIQKNAS